jgi:micrococcal nuclease
MIRNRVKACLSLLTLFIFSCAPSSYDYSNIKVVKVIDGDTIRLANGKLLRYIGIDTPEIRIKQGGKFVYQPSPFSLEAKKNNQQLVGDKFVRIEFDVEKYDRYGRLLGYCFVNETFVNAKLLEEGYAVLYTKPPNIKYVDLFVKLQKKARKEKRGIWGSYQIIDHTQAGQYINQIRTVRGRVVSTYQSEKCVFLNFGRDWRNDFTVVIFNNALKFFYERGINPLTFYRGKTIEVSGRIRKYNGPEIIVNIPDEITIVSSQ